METVIERPQVGITYKCREGWFRKIYDVRDTAGYVEVRFWSGRSPMRMSRQTTWNPMQWFASQIVHVAHNG